MSDVPHPNFVELTADLTVAWLSNPEARISAADLPTLIRTVHDGLSSLSQRETTEPAAPEYVGAVSERKSLSDPNRIISMIDGKGYSMLTRHLKQHGLTPDEYRARYNLKPTYPMVAPGYSARRSELAKALGLGKQGGRRKAGAAQPTAKRGRKAAAKAAE